MLEIIRATECISFTFYVFYDFNRNNQFYKDLDLFGFKRKTSLESRQNRSKIKADSFGGEGGIRTLETL